MIKCVLAGALLCLAPVGIARASETTTYTYDELGRLVTSSIQGGPNAGVSSSATFDPVGNRTVYAVGGSCTLTVADAGTNDEFSVYAWVYASGSCQTPITLSYSTQDGTAINGTHYYGVAGTVQLTSVANGVGARVTPVYGSVHGDELKVFYVNFSVQSGSATFSDSQSTIIIGSSN